MDERVKKQIEFIIEADKMKSVLRRNLISDKSRRENDAEHSWHIALAAMLLMEHAAEPEKINLSRVLQMAATHDLVEIYAGDTFAYDKSGNEDKDSRERQAADRLFSSLPVEQGEYLRSLWEEFDAMETPSSRFAAAIDRIQPLILNSVTQGHTWVQGKVTRTQVLERMDMIRLAAPGLWGYVLDTIEQAIEKGYIIDK